MPAMQMPPVLLFDLRARQVRELDRHAARQALADHSLALIDPPPALDLVAVCWWAMRLDLESRAPRLIGPAVHFPAEDFASPVLPIGGVSTSDALRLYIQAAPVPDRTHVSVLPPGDRIPLRAVSVPPGLFRRTVALPVQYLAPGAADRRQVFEARARVLPGPEWLAGWYWRQRAEWWCRYALHRFLADATEGRIACYGGLISGQGRGAQEGACELHRIPQSFFASDLEVDVERGQLFTLHDRRMPLVSGLRFHAAADVPAE